MRGPHLPPILQAAGQEVGGPSGGEWLLQGLGTRVSSTGAVRSDGVLCEHCRREICGSSSDLSLPSQVLSGFHLQSGSGLPDTHGLALIGWGGNAGLVGGN